MTRRRHSDRAIFLRCECHGEKTQEFTVIAFHTPTWHATCDVQPPRTRTTRTSPRKEGSNDSTLSGLWLHDRCWTARDDERRPGQPLLPSRIWTSRLPRRLRGFW